MYYQIPLNKVNDLYIDEYRLMVFTVFNNANLINGLGEFEYQTADEAVDELDQQIKHYKSIGLL